jgi:hypothetical protein
MSHSAEQMRKKAEAMREAHMHHKHATVDGERPRAQHNSHMAHMNDGMGSPEMKNMDMGE